MLKIAFRIGAVTVNKGVDTTLQPNYDDVQRRKRQSIMSIVMDHSAGFLVL